MDEQPKVSIIIPVYNTEAYLREAVESVMQQTLHEIEIIIVNDGSTDGCSSIIDELASKDKRIHSFVQENQGQSVARNNGMLHAEGTYCYFMDSDDILRKDALEECYQTCEAETLDFVYFDADIINECQSTSFSMDYHHDGIEEKVYDGSEILNYLIDTGQLKIPPYLFFIRKQYLLNNDLHFFPGIIHEDELFTMLLYLGATRVKYIGKEFFLRRIREASTMTKRISRRNVEGYFTVFRELGKYAAGKSPLVQNIIVKYIKLTLNAFLRNAHEMTMIDKLRTCKRCLNEGLVKYISLRVFIRFLLP
jgi:glycosyltransferase involved in cell wall biosynthesis